MILEIVILVAIILNLAGMGLAAFMKKTNVLIVLAILEAALGIIFALIAS